MSKQYAKLSDEILLKKINASKTQLLTLLDFVKHHDPNIHFYVDDLSENPSREELENMCDTLNTLITSMKNEQKSILDKQKEEQKQVEEEQEVEEKEDKINYECLVNLDDIKRSFFNPTNEEFKPFLELLNETPFVFYKGSYKYNDELTNKADYIVRNRNKSFIKRFEYYSKYLFVCFKCHEEKNQEYKYESFWLFNSMGAFEDYIIQYNDDIEFTKIDKDEFIDHFAQNKGLFDQIYLH